MLIAGGVQVLPTAADRVRRGQSLHDIARSIVSHIA
jgi:hypothetical protein